MTTDVLPALHVMYYLKEHFPDHWMNHGSPQNWPPQLPDLSPLNSHVCGYMKSMAYECKVDTTDGLLQQIFSAARCLNEG